MHSPFRRRLRPGETALPGRFRSLVGLGVQPLLGMFRRSLPPPPRLPSELTLDGTDGPVRIRLDGHGIPYIHARSRRDSALGLGFMHGMDRLLQLDIGRLLARGRAAAVLGPIALDVDKAARILGMGRWAEEYLSRMSESRRAILEGYALGVNRAIERRGGHHPGRLGRIFGPVAPWSPVDSLAAARVGGVDFGFFRVPALSAAAARLGREVAREVFPSSRDVDRFFASGLFRELTFGSNDTPSPAATPGSNAWAIAPGRSASGGALLASDPHLGFTAPGIFYLASFTVGDRTVTGLTIPSLPSVVIGTNGRMAWGLTNAMAAQSVLYRETILTNPPDHYVCEGAPVPLSIREETIDVRFARPATVRVRSTHRGPVLSDSRLLRFGDVDFSAWWAGLQELDELDGFFGLEEADSPEEMEAAAAHLGCPGLNVVYACRDGRIGKITAGQFPWREGFDGSLMLDGRTREFDIAKTVPPERWPRDHGSGGFVVSANEAPPTREGDALWSLFPSPDHRARRIREMLEETGRHTVETALAPQNDVHSVYARELTEKVLATVSRSSLDARARRAADLLGAWDFVFAPHSTGACVFHGFFQALVSRLFLQRLGPSLFKKFRQGYAAFVTVEKLVSLPGNALWEGDMAAVVGRALSDGVRDLERHVGRSEAAWRWDRVMRLELCSPYSVVPGLGFGRARIPMGPARGTYTTPFQIMHRGHNVVERASLGPSARILVEFPPVATGRADAVASAGPESGHDRASREAPVTVRAVLSSGQSEFPASPHFADMAEIYRLAGMITLDAE